MSSRYSAGIRISEYVLEQLLGTGTFGEVWRARHHIWEKDLVAVKLPTEPDYVRHLQREGVMVHGLRHPNIVRVVGLDPYAEHPYLVMELVNGPSLRDVLNERREGVGLQVATTVMRGVLRGLQAAHAANVLHRDLKPGNVLLNLHDKPLPRVAVEDVKLSDFGLGVGDAEGLKAVAQSASLERDNRLVGTLAYIAPELRDDGHKPDARSDLYSLGIVLFELLTGQRPAGAELPSSLRGGIPRALDEIFAKLYARYERRYASAAAVLHDLERAAGVRSAAAGAPPAGLAPARHFALGRQACARCGQLAGPHDQFCTNCGGQLVAHVRRCGSCGQYPGPFDRFCILCGSRLAEAEGSSGG